MKWTWKPLALQIYGSLRYIYTYSEPELMLLETHFRILASAYLLCVWWFTSCFGYTVYFSCLLSLSFSLLLFHTLQSTEDKQKEKKIFDWMKLNIQSTTCLSTSNSMNIKPYAWITPRWALVALQVDRCVTRADKLLRSVFIYIVSMRFFRALSICMSFFFSLLSRLLFFFVQDNFFRRCYLLTNFTCPKTEIDIEIEWKIDRQIWISISVWIIIANSKSCR